MNLIATHVNIGGYGPEVTVTTSGLAIRKHQSIHEVCLPDIILLFPQHWHIRIIPFSVFHLKPVDFVPTTRRLTFLLFSRCSGRIIGVFYQAVRCPFEEGEPVYAGGMIKEQSHIQIAVRDRACICGRIFLVGSKEISNE